MVLKVDGGVSPIRREEPVTPKPVVKPAVTTSENPQTNAAVYTNQSNSNNQAGILRTRLNAQFTPVQQTPTPLTPQEAETRADQIIADNGGKDNLDTEG